MKKQKRSNKSPAHKKTSDLSKSSSGKASEIVPAAPAAAGRKPRRVEMKSVETFFEIKDGQPTLRHKRYFTNTSSDRLLFLLMGVKFYGPGGLMATSTADAEECSPDGTFRLVKNFKPLQNTPNTYVAGSFSVSQRLLEFSLGPLGVSAITQMSFTPPNPDSPGPWGSLLWAIEPGRTDLMEPCAYWTDLVNTEETRSRNLELKVKPGSAEILMALHNRLIGGAGRRVTEILNATSYDQGVVFADYVKSGQLSFLIMPKRSRKR